MASQREAAQGQFLPPRGHLRATGPPKISPQVCQEVVDSRQPDEIAAAVDEVNAVEDSDEEERSGSASPPPGLMTELVDGERSTTQHRLRNLRGVFTTNWFSSLRNSEWRRGMGNGAQASVGETVETTENTGKACEQASPGGIRALLFCLYVGLGRWGGACVRTVCPR